MGSDVIFKQIVSELSKIVGLPACTAEDGLELGKTADICCQCCEYGKESKGETDSKSFSYTACKRNNLIN